MVYCPDLRHTYWIGILTYLLTYGGATVHEGPGPPPQHRARPLGLAPPSASLAL